MDAIVQVKTKNKNYNVQVNFKEEVNEDFDTNIKGNEYLLQVAFINLMENAYKFSKSNQSNVSITPCASGILLEFWDKGIGISEADLEYVFSPIFRGKNKNFSEGHGIGLYLTKKNVSLHRGEIEVKSKLNNGTTFKVFLPH